MPQPIEPLCVTCGLCCDGTLFGAVRLSEQEAHRLVVLGVASVERPDGSRRLLQRCPALERTDRAANCRVYAERPQSCRRFDCLLAKALGEGEVSLEEAAEVVASVRRLSAEVEALLPAHHAGEAPRSLEGRVAAARGRLPDETALEERWSALTTLMDRSFRG